jgi:hypothetical protein
LFLRQATRNEITPLTDRKDIWQCLLATLIRPVLAERVGRVGANREGGEVLCDEV